MKQASIFVFGLTFAFATIPTISYAQTAPGATRIVSEQECTIAKETITSNAETSTALKVKRSVQYDAIKEQLYKVQLSATKAQYIKLDALLTARDTLTAKLGAYNAQAQVYETALKATLAAPCSEDSSQFANAVISARTELVTLRESAVAVKAAVKENALPALKEYAKWLGANAPSTNSTEGNS